MIHIVNDRGQVFHVRVVLKGEHYGLEDRLVHDSDNPLVQFYAADVHPEIHGPRGYLVSYYFLSTLEDVPCSTGILLNGAGDKPYSSVTTQNVSDAIAYAHRRLAEEMTRA